MPLTENIIKKIADDTGIKIDDLTTLALLSLLREKRRRMIMEKMEILRRYNGMDLSKFENKIKTGEIAEHPAWEDLITLENLEDAIARLDEDIKAIQ